MGLSLMEPAEQLMTKYILKALRDLAVILFAQLEQPAQILFFRLRVIVLNGNVLAPADRVHGVWLLIVILQQTATATEIVMQLQQEALGVLVTQAGMPHLIVRTAL